MLVTKENYDEFRSSIPWQPSPPEVSIRRSVRGGWSIQMKASVLRLMGVAPGDIVRLRFFYDREYGRMGFCLVDDDDQAHSIRTLTNKMAIRLDITRVMRFMVGRDIVGRFPAAVDTDARAVWWRVVNAE